jgi:hypothetical protein
MIINGMTIMFEGFYDTLYSKPNFRAMNRRSYLSATSGILIGLASGCLGVTGGGSTTTPTSAVQVVTRDTNSENDGTLTIRWRPATFQAFQWEGSGKQFYEAAEGEQYLIVQLELHASDRSLEFSARRLEAFVNSRDLGTHAFTGDLAVDHPIQPDSPVTGWRAWTIGEDVEKVKLRHQPLDYTYDTEFDRDNSLEFTVSSYDPP